MNSKKKILNLLREEKNRWEDLLAGMSEEQIVAPNLPSHWSVKDVIAHLTAWQQITNARLQAALQNHEPEYPHWPEGLDHESEEDLDQINAWIFDTHHDQDWASVYRAWQDSFQHVLDYTEAIPESDLTEVGKYTWIEGYALSAVELGTYEHHEEHLESLRALL
ncbi:MAG: ClbS/DfsB family four-helix bundle protein [Anaerolineales bacterium]